MNKSKTSAKSSTTDISNIYEWIFQRTYIKMILKSFILLYDIKNKKENLWKIYLKTLNFDFFGDIICACSSKEPNLQTVQKVQLDKYLGTWYEIARYEHFFEKDCKNVSANYWC